MRFLVTILTNNTDGHRFWAFHPGDTFDARVTIPVDAPDTVGALNAAWVVGNRMAPDADGNAWPRNVRSMSMADVALVDTPDGLAGWAVASVGFDPIPAADLPDLATIPATVLVPGVLDR